MLRSPQRFAWHTAALFVAAVVQPTAHAASPQATDCFADLMRGTSPEITCTLPLRPSATERADLEAHSRGYVKDAVCTVSIRISRAAIMTAVHATDHVFAAPAQPVSCNVTAHWSEKSGPTVLPIAATFAPKVTISGGTAVEATPGLSNIQGVPRALSWPVETWVNSGVGIKSDMLRVINAWLDHMRRNRPQERQATR